MRGHSAVILCMILALASTAALAAPIVTGDLMELINPEKAAYLRDSVCTQVSSYDRTGDNDDGFSGKYSHIRMEGENFVIFDSEGPGCIYRLWSANAGKGWIKFYFDGETTPRVQFNRWEDMFTNVKYPFVPPLSQHFLGGWCSYVPMPFAKSLKIVAQGPVRFLQITWHKFPSAEGVTSFDPNYTQEERMKLVRVKRAWTQLGQPPMPLPATANTIRRSVRVKPNATAELAGLAGSGMVRAIRLKATSEDQKFLRKTLLLMNVDKQKTPSIYSPIGDFFLDPFGGENAQSLLVGKKDGGYYSYWVMPYSSGASIRVKNESVRPVSIDCEVVYEPMQALPPGTGRFFAWWHRQSPTIKGELFPILNAKGRGHWCGVSHAMQGGGEGLGFLEGDEFLWIDDRDNSYYNGTGTEDYFNGGWYFGNIGSAPFYGCGYLDGGSGGKCHAYRIHMTDLVPFQEKARIGIEHGHGNTIPADYAGVTYAYLAPGTTHDFGPAPVVERLDRPAASVDVVEAENIYDSKSGGVVVDDVNEPFFLSGGQGISTKRDQGFSLKIDAPEASAYQLVVAFQKGPNRGVAQASVDGQPVGQPVDTYSEKLVNRSRVRIGVTPELTKGSHVLTIESVGENDKATGTDVVADFIVLKPDLIYEGEEMEVANTVKTGATTQTLGREFSGGAHFFMTSREVGAIVTLKFNVARAGKYPLSAWMTKAADYGIVSLKLDGKLIGQPFDGYNDGVIRELVKLGEAELSAGEHQLTFEITGKNDKSASYLAGMDYLSLR